MNKRDKEIRKLKTVYVKKQNLEFVKKEERESWTLRWPWTWRRVCQIAMEEWNEVRRKLGRFIDAINRTRFYYYIYLISHMWIAPSCLFGFLCIYLLLSHGLPSLDFLLQLSTSNNASPYVWHFKNYCHHNNNKFIFMCQCCLLLWWLWNIDDYHTIIFYIS